MSNKVLRVARACVQAYSFEAESWKPDHQAAMRCRDLEDFLEAGIELFDYLMKIDERHRARVFAGEEEYCPDVTEGIESAIRLWLVTADEVARVLVLFERQFSIVKFADEFRSRWQQAKGIITSDSDFFGSGLVPLRDRAIDENNRNETVECRSWE